VARLLASAILAPLLLALLTPAISGAQSPAEAERYFRVEHEPQAIARRGWALEGYVYSSHTYRVGGMRLRVQVLDGDGKVLGEGYGWVPGDVPSGGRAYFVLPVPQKGAAYRVSVVSYFLVSRDAP
jgi:hypothetical protein